MNEVLRDAMERRKDRAIAIILKTKERECDKHLPKDASLKMRKVVLDQINDFYEVCIELVEAVDDNSMVINELWVQKLNELHSIVVTNGKSL